MKSSGWPFTPWKTLQLPLHGGESERDLVVMGIDQYLYSSLESVGCGAHVLFSTVQFRVGHCHRPRTTGEHPGAISNAPIEVVRNFVPTRSIANSHSGGQTPAMFSV